MHEDNTKAVLTLANEANQLVCDALDELVEVIPIICTTYYYLPCYYFAPGGSQCIVLSMSVYLAVCLICSHNSKTTRSIFTKFLTHVVCGHGSFLL